jgi:hypothetical protein
MANDLQAQLLARAQQQPQANPIISGLGDVRSVGNIAKMAKPLLGGNTLGGLLGPGIGQAGGSLAGDIIPGAGAALGIYNMIQNRGNVSNLLSGAGTGASIGSMIMPGIGTGIGAGIGALAGGVEDLFNIGKPSQTELQGRDANSRIQQALSSVATPAQMAEAQKAVASGAWPDTKGPLQIIVTRDALVQRGMDPAQADKTAQNIAGNTWNAEKQGGNAVAQAAGSAFYPGSTIQKMMPSPTANPSPTGQLGQSQLPYTTDAFSSGAINSNRPSIPNQSSNFIF